MTCSDAYNLPPGLAPSGIPGNSREEVTVGRAMEEAEVKIADAVDSVAEARAGLLKALSGSPKDAMEYLKRASNTLEHTQVDIDDALNILGRVLK